MPNEEENGPAPTWNPTKDTTLDSLIDIVDPAQATATKPWRSGYELYFSAFGGLRNRERQSVIVATGGYSSLVTSHLDTHVTSDYSVSFKKTVSYTFSRSAEEADLERMDDSIPVTWGNDTLTVNGFASIQASNKNLTMAGNYKKYWRGGITRFAGQDGGMYAGFFSRIHAGPSMSLSAIVSADVYGGSARATGTRIGVIGLNYRSADQAAVAYGYYGQFSNITIIPPVRTPNKHMKKKDWAAKLLYTTFPLAEIVFGVLSAPLSIINMIRNHAGIKKEIEQFFSQQAPRTLIKNYGIRQVNAGSSTIV